MSCKLILFHGPWKYASVILYVKTRQVFILSIDDTNMLIYKNRKQKILLLGLHLQNYFNMKHNF